MNKGNQDSIYSDELTQPIVAKFHSTCVADVKIQNRGPEQEIPVMGPVRMC